MRRSAMLAIGAAVLAVGAPSPAQVARPAAPAKAPANPAFAELDARYRALVDGGKLAGIVTLVAQGGRVRHVQAYGVQDIDTRVPVRADTIWRIASMTKPIVGVAMMILYEQGKWTLDDPVAKHIPEFRDLKVKAPDGSLVPQDHPMTMRELMSHTAGFAAAAPGVDLRATDLQGMIDTLAQVRLAAQPGSDWIYGPSVDIQGYLVEKLSGQRLDRFLQDRILTPLKMADTQFWVDPAKLPRLSRLHAFDAAGKLVGSNAYPISTAPPRFLSGGGGLYSTAPDYLRFARMLLNRGTLDGARILKPETVALMQRNVLRPGIKVDLYGPSMAGIGFGLDLALVLDPAAASTPQGRGTYYWGGAFGTWFWVDPVNDLIMIGMIQNVNGSTPGRGTPSLRPIAYPLVYRAIGR